MKGGENNMDNQEVKEISLEQLTDLVQDAVASAVAKNQEVTAKAVADKAGEDVISELKGVEKELAFVKALLTGDSVNAKALSEGTDSAGGYLVPEEFANRILEKQRDIPSVRSLSTVINMNTDKMNVPSEGTDMTFAWTAENATISASDPSFGEVELTPNVLAGLVKLSRQLADDNSVGLLDYLARAIARGVNEAEDLAFTGGSGTGQPKGFRQYTISQSVAQAGGTLVYSDVVNLMYTLPSAYRNRASFMTSDAGAKALASIVDGNSRPIFVPAPDAKGFATLFGRPVYINDNIPSNLGGGTDETELWFGDYSYYLIGDRAGIATEYSTEAGEAFEKHQGWLKVVKRTDGKLAYTEAMAKLTAVK